MILGHHARQLGHDFGSVITWRMRATQYFTMNEASGALVNRGSTGTTHNASTTGSPTYGDAGLISGTALTFNGSSQYAATPNTIGGSNDVWTAGVWFKSSSASTVKTFLTIRSSASGLANEATLVLILNHPSVGNLTVQGFGSNSVTASGSSYNDNARHLAIISISASLVFLWIDGAFIGSGAHGSVGVANVSMGLAANVSSTPIQHFPGTLDEAFALRTIAMNNANALTIYNAGIR
jgi:hypothetical protein